MFLAVAAAALVVITLAATVRPSGPHTLGLDLTADGSHTLRVDRVTSGTVAQAMGLEPGDLITSVNGGPALSPWVLRNAASDAAPLNLHVSRGDKRFRAEIEFDAVIGMWPTVRSVATTPLN